MTDPITPPPELVEQWISEIWHDGTPVKVSLSDEYLASRAAQWGADQELEACCEWFANEGYGTAPDRIRTARRPNPPSLKKQALSDLRNAYDADMIDDTTFENILRALESLND